MMNPKDIAVVYAVLLFIVFFGGAWLYSRYLKREGVERW